MESARVSGLLSGVLLSAALALFGCAGQPVVSTSESVGQSQEALSACVDLRASADATLSYAEMRRNFGSKKVLRAGERDESLVSFDLSSIPAAAAIDSATLKLYVSDADSKEPIDIHRATASWAESTVTFASFAQHFDRQVLGSIVVKRENVQKSVDLTALTTSWVTGAQPNYGVLLDNRAREETTFVSREGGIAEQKPTLRVCYTTPDDHCTPNPCLHGASCENGANGFVCHCQAGYTGTTCETNVNDCANSPCQNGGVCEDGVNNYSCACAAGYTGANCESNIDDCAGSPCQNGGVCEDRVASYTCHCPPGYSGANCETLIDNCGSQPCQNGGTCTSGVNSYACSCAVGFSGTNCEINIDDCMSQPCHNGGTCVDGIHAYACACPPDWGGAACDVNLSKCSQNPCLNGSTCANGSGNYTCTCAPGFAGTNCEIDINDCAGNPCQNGGVCTDGVNSYSCACATRFSGTNCETNACTTTCSTCSYPTVHLRATIDNEGELFVNGTSVGTISLWYSPLDVDVSALVSPGQKNVIAVRGANVSNQDGNDRGIVAELLVDLGGGATPLLVTDSAWRIATTELPGWTDLAYDDSAWSQAVEIATDGDQPWGPLLSTSSAKWIWSALVPFAAGDKPESETTYARRTFNLALDGKGLDAAPACP